MFSDSNYSVPGIRIGDRFYQRRDPGFEPFPAELVEAQTFTETKEDGSDGDTIDCWKWREVIALPFGKYEPLEGGRSGDFERDPLFETGTVTGAAVGDIVWPYPGFFEASGDNDGSGRHWVFDCGCDQNGNGGIEIELVEDVCPIDLTIPDGTYAQPGDIISGGTF